MYFLESIKSFKSFALHGYFHSPEGGNTDSVESTDLQNRTDTGRLSFSIEGVLEGVDERLHAIQLSYGLENTGGNTEVKNLGELSLGEVSPQGINLEGLSQIQVQIVGFALELYERGDIFGAQHCTDWVDKIYHQQTGNSLYSAPMSFNGGIYTVPPQGSHDTGFRAERYAEENEISSIKPGDHIMVDHGPNFGSGRTHSVIALEPPNGGLVRVVSYPNGGEPPRVELYDLTGAGNQGARPEKAMRIHSLA